MVCHPDLEDLLQPWPAEVPDEFFEVTVDDVRRRLAQLKSERWVPLALWLPPVTLLCGFTLDLSVLLGEKSPLGLGEQGEGWLLSGLKMRRFSVET